MENPRPTAISTVCFGGLVQVTGEISDTAPEFNWAICVKHIRKKFGSPSMRGKSG